MRVLAVGNMYPPHHLGGYELVWRSSVAHLQDAGHEVEVLTTDFRHEHVAPAHEPGVFRDLRWWWSDGRWPRQSPAVRLAKERHNAGVFDAAVARLRPDVIAWWSMGGMSLSLIERGRQASLPAVGFVHDDWLVYGPHVDRWLHMWQRAVTAPVAAVARRVGGLHTDVDFSAAALWAFVSEHTRSRALRDRSLERTTVLPSGIDAAFLDPQPSPPWRWRLLFAGRIDERKGVRTAVQALAHLPPDAQLSVAGSGDLSLLEGAQRRVEHLGPLGTQALRRAYATADAVLFPVSWHEPWGLVPLEAMAMGRPVVATRQGGSAEYLRDGVNCVVCAPADPASLARAVRRLEASADLRRRLCEEGVRTAAAHTAAEFNRRAEDLLLGACAGGNRTLSA